MNRIDPQSWKADLPEFREKTTAFYAGDLDKMAYKGFSGLYGSYAQKGGKASMLRLRMTAGRVTREKLALLQKRSVPTRYPGSTLPPARPSSFMTSSRKPFLILWNGPWTAGS